MKHEIFYERVFIKIGENQFIPMVQHGGKNSFYCLNGKWIPEKIWSNLEHENKLVFAKEEIGQLVRAFVKYEPFKTKHTAFTAEEAFQWFKDGINTAKPLESYINDQVAFVVIELEYRVKQKYSKVHPVKSTKELLSKLEGLEKLVKKKDIKIKLRFENLCLQK